MSRKQEDTGLGMFRRRTDRIYATLQQVQRRITQGTEAPGGEGDSQSPDSATSVPNIRTRAPTALPGSSYDSRSLSGFVIHPDGTRRPDTGYVQRSQTQAGAGQSPAQPPVNQPEQAALEPVPSSPAVPQSPLHVRTPEQMRQAGMQPQQPAHPGRDMTMGGDYGTQAAGGSYAPPVSKGPVTNPQLSLAAGEGRPRRLEVGMELAGIIVVLWIATVGVAFYIGLRQGGGVVAQSDRPGALPLASSVDDAPDTQAADDGSRDAPSGPHVEPLGDHVLILTSVARYSDNQNAEYNDLAVQYNDVARQNGLPAWFGVRRTQNNGLQFVYGVRDGVYGINRNAQDSEMIYRELKGNYPSAYWLPINR